MEPPGPHNPTEEAWASVWASLLEQANEAVPPFLRGRPKPSLPELLVEEPKPPSESWGDWPELHVPPPTDCRQIDAPPLLPPIPWRLMDGRGMPQPASASATRKERQCRRKSTPDDRAARRHRVPSGSKHVNYLSGPRPFCDASGCRRPVVITCYWRGCPYRENAAKASTQPTHVAIATIRAGRPAPINDSSRATRLE